ncbi:MAG: Holliday junction branch migration protein RuvA [Leptospiraceae bacterium]|nr:Holliday junction branch migration protein RuvA [Leptospiraceae bacterium]
MIYGLRGKIFQLDFHKIYLDTGTVVYEVFIPFKIYEELKDTKKEDVFIYIYHSINDRGQKLFGFKNKKERDLFELLKSLQGIGEMTALRVLSFMNVEQLLEVVKTQDKSLLEKIPKIKGKTSEKILFEVKQNIKKFENFLEEGNNQNSKETKGENNNEIAIMALVQLGFDEKTATKLVNQAIKNGVTDTGEIIKESLKTN